MDWAESLLEKDDGWGAKIRALRQMLKSTGAMWPDSTKLSGYGEKGPYHCGDCKFLEGGKYCSQPVVGADEQVKKDKDGKPMVNAQRGCCEFVDPK